MQRLAAPGEELPQVVPTRRAARPRRLRELLWLTVVGVGVTLVVVVGQWLVGSPEEPDRDAPGGGASTPPRASVVLDSRGNVDSGAIEFRTDKPVLHLTVAAGSGPTAGFSPDVRNVRVLVGGEIIQVKLPIRPGERHMVELPAGSKQVRVEYSSTGTFQPTSPDDPAQGTALLTPLTIEENAEPGTVEVSDPRVQDVGCVVGDETTPCGDDDGTSWVAEPDPAGADVVADVDLDTTDPSPEG
jgi:hypothetical protein